LAQQVTARLNRRTQPRYVRWRQGWKRCVAAAAALIVVTTGTLGLAFNQFWTRTTTSIAENNDKPVVVCEEPRTGDGSGMLPGDNPSGGREDASAGAATGRSGVEDEKPHGGPPTTAPDSRPPVTNNTGGDQAPRPEGYSFASIDPEQKRVLESTLLVVRVSSLEEAGKMVEALASDPGIKYEDLGTSGRQATYKITVAKSRSSALLQKLSALGQVVTRQETGRDITEQFRNLAQQLRDLAAQKEAAGDAAQSAALEARRADIAKQLHEWMALEDRHTVVLVVQEQ